MKSGHQDNQVAGNLDINPQDTSLWKNKTSIFT
jgi:hypothetical protein